MNRKIKFALAALLGFSAACSSVKHSSAGKDRTQERVGAEAQPDSLERRIMVMYGVPSPERRQPVASEGVPMSGPAADSSDTPTESAPNAE